MRRNRPARRALAAALLGLTLTGCMSVGAAPERGETWIPTEDIPAIPEKLERDETSGVPVLSVYDTSEKTTERMDIETYVTGVVAGEMKNDWPPEALKAQAILARTFVLKFCEEKRSKYEGADISTDVTEAQAYAAGNVNERVRQAVEETRGQVIAHRGELVQAWFHAHSGGMTERPGVALEYREDPEYLVPVQSQESGDAPDDVKRWTAGFPKSSVARACADTGVKVGDIERVEVGERGESGRARTLLVDGVEVSAPSFRIQIGANRLKSTLIDSIGIDGDTVTFTGRGFGHGVGLSQWGAYALAERGEAAEDIIRHYYSGVDIAKLW